MTSSRLGEEGKGSQIDGREGEGPEHQGNKMGTNPKCEKMSSHLGADFKGEATFSVQRRVKQIRKHDHRTLIFYSQNFNLTA